MTDKVSCVISQDEDTGQPLSDRHLRDEVVSMMIAGHETTALILSWAWHLLAEHPDVERRLHQELDDVLGDQMPTIADLERRQKVGGSAA